MTATTKTAKTGVARRADKPKASDAVKRENRTGWAFMAPFGILFALVFIAIIISITTMVNAMVFTLSDMSTKAEYLKEGALSKSSSNILKIYWGLIIGLTAFILLFSGGLGALQTASVVCGLPILALLLVMAVSYIKSMRQRSKYDMTLTEEEKSELLQEELGETSEATIPAKAANE